MASLVLGAVGAFFFGPIGFLVGSLIGNLLFPGKGQDGPRLNKLQLQGSSYGTMIPIIYGKVRLAGQVIWQTDLKEHKHTSGGKGGPAVTTYTYTASFAVKICKGEVGGVSRIWANGAVAYDTTGESVVENSLIPVTFYLGDETADPDPTMEMELGVGNVPAFRDDCVAVFTDWDLGDFGNTLPQLSFEVFSVGGPIPWRVSTFAPVNYQSIAGFAGTGPLNGALENGDLIMSDFGSPHVSVSATPFPFTVYHYDLQGNLRSTEPTILCDPPPDTETFIDIYPCVNAPRICWLHCNASDDYQKNLFYYNGAVAGPALGPGGLPGVFAINNVPVFGNDALYAAGGQGTAYVAKWAAPDGVPTGGSPLASAALPGSSGQAWTTVVDDAGDVWCVQEPVLVGDQIHHFDGDLNFIASYPLGPSGIQPGSATITVWNNIFYFASTGIGYAYTLAGGVFTPTDPGTIQTAAGNCISLGNGYVVGPDGVIALTPKGGPVTLASIVSDLSVRAGLTTADIDVTDLPDLVDGYIVSTQADCRTDIEPLRSGFFFDATESQSASGRAVAKFVKRGGAIAVTIPDRDLAAINAGKAEKMPRLVDVKRAQEVDLPAAVNVTYINRDASYQNGTQRTIRQTTSSQAVSSVELAIVMDDAKARQVANVLLFSTWMERNALIIRTSRKYAYLEPTDIISAGGYVLRVEKKREIEGGLIEWEGPQTNAAVYNAAPAGNPTVGSGSPPVVRRTQLTDALLLDIPLIDGSEDPNGFYAAMAGSVDNTWRGAILNESRDTGTSYFSIETDSVADVIGTTSTTLGDFGGGNVFDEINRVTVVIGNGGGELSSASADAVLNGANIALVGDEIIQYKTATLTAPSTYALSGLLRGRQGTEWAMASHTASDRFALLPVNDVSRPFADIAQPWLYKAVTAGSTLAGTPSQAFTNNGARLRCYSPVQLGGGVDAAGTIILQWNRRTRIGGLWLNFVDALLSEANEFYYVYIYADNTFATLLRTIPVSAATSLDYDTSLQTTDFGSPQSSVSWGVAQIGTLGPGIEARQTTP